MRNLGRVLLLTICVMLPTAAWGQVVTLRGNSFLNHVVADTVTNDLRIWIEGAYSGSQLRIQLTSGSIYQDPQGGVSPPSEAQILDFPSVEFDTYVANGSLTAGGSFGEPGVLGGAVNLGGASTVQFDEAGIDVTWHPSSFEDPPTDLLSYFTNARITLSSDAQGTWSYLGSAGGQFGLVENMPIRNGKLQGIIPGDFDDSGLVGQGDLDIVLLNWGTSNFPGDERTIPPVPGEYDGLTSGNELDAVLLNWGNGNSFVQHLDVVDPAATGGQITGIEGEFNGSGQVEQADFDLAFLNWGQVSTPPPTVWVNDLPTATAIDADDLERVTLNWGDAGGLSALVSEVPEPSVLLLALTCQIAAIGCLRFANHL